MLVELCLIRCAGIQTQYPAVNIPALGLTVPGGLPPAQTHGLPSQLHISQVGQAPLSFHPMTLCSASVSAAVNTLPALCTSLCFWLRSFKLP